MSEYKKCDRCKRFVWSANHVCPPTFMVRVKVEDTFHVVHEVHADDPEAAAVRGVQMVDSFFDSTFPIASKAWTVEVQVVDYDGNVFWYNIDGALEPVYYKSTMSATIGRDTVEKVVVENFEGLPTYQIGDLLLIYTHELSTEEEREDLDRFMVGQTRPGPLSVHPQSGLDSMAFIYLHDYDRFQKMIGERLYGKHHE